METLKIILPALACAGCAYWIFALACIILYRQEAPPARPESQYPPISILKPVKGADRGFGENLKSFCTQDYPEYEVIVGTEDADDQAIQIAGQIGAETGGRVKVVVTGALPGPNRKVSLLEKMAQTARNDLVAVSDGDMRVDETYLKTIAAEYLEGAGMVTSLYRITGPVSAGSALESLAIATDFMPSVMVARVVEGGLSFGFGASMLFSRGALDEAGGWGPIAHYLADDYQLGKRLFDTGRSVRLSRYIMDLVPGREGLGDYLSRQLRWARTYRTSRPKGYLGYGVTHALTYGLAYLLAVPGPLSAALFAAIFVFRYGAAFAVYGKFIRKKSWLKWLVFLPVRDIAGFFVWAVSFAGNKVSWRGRVFKVGKGGIMEDKC